MVRGEVAVDHALPLRVAFLNELEGGLEDLAHLRFGVAVGLDVDLVGPTDDEVLVVVPIRWDKLLTEADAAGDTDWTVSVDWTITLR